MNLAKSTASLSLAVLIGVLGLIACDDQPPVPTPTPAPPSPTPVALTGSPSAGMTPRPSFSDRTTPADQALLQRALDTSDTLNSYHYVLEVRPTNLITQAMRLEGDRVAPDKGYLKGTLGDQQVERLVHGESVYTKDGSGQWVKAESANPTINAPGQLVNPEDFTANSDPVKGFRTFLNSASEIETAGDEPIDGVTTKRFNFNLDMDKFMGAEAESYRLQSGKRFPSLGGGAAWVQPDTGHLRRLHLKLDIKPLVEVYTEMYQAGLGGTPTPGGPTATPIPSMNVDISITVSRHNDPSIKIPDPPSSEQPGPGASATPVP